ncbi:hypothetical protein IQ266_24970 [filamentous cyanobacterium LEGE 11480]|uniref:LSDAT prokaryote domain-containing protein n=1 Tax=Romeriopsis navalis LEGE 11480 TaxID=2777977 RepID=A0A928VVV0_9CYAN|nr:hypothetical protein [Romeriopsis navalis]MBE9032994.1 hypothetical protein [Romeriopsis navalis LEGE 11480]
MSPVSTIALSERTTSQVMEMHAGTVTAEDLAPIVLPHKRPVLVVIGGAKFLGDDVFQQIRGFFHQVLARTAQKLDAVVMDGGTDSGVMRLMGQARQETGAKFPLVGVSPRGLVLLPGEQAISEEQTTLEPHHSHFILVPGSNWGDESQALAQVATTIAEGAPTIAVMLNGGAITWKDAIQNVKQGRLLLVIDGTGRAADELAAVVRGEPGCDEAQALVATGLVRVAALTEGNLAIAKAIEAILAPTIA